ncbi:hypothetical protein H696_02320 [Fonticula alba]|uniref:Peptidase M24 domain-containing protein n=1 Tax=Fonticula alba TaxID=691883 RepID=A0A058ZBR9_FONAL|nr:hypothetical protein H696_02320 [Fonticula alba]KCV71368.1 hypothetical protein H696_02320 [Fonticula alba]|eukprot:XP_009494491.1 hypothetical protein H696_02320 [Fonticula alba]
MSSQYTRVPTEDTGNLYTTLPLPHDNPSTNHHLADPEDYAGGDKKSSSSAGGASSDALTRSKWFYPVLVLCFILMVVVGVLLALIFTRPFSDGNSRKYAHLNGYCADVPAITETEFADRRVRLSNEMVTSGVDVLVTEAGSTMLYMAGAKWKRSERPFLAVLSRLGRPADDPGFEYFFVSPAFEHDKASEVVKGAALVYYQEDESPYLALARHLGLDPDAADPPTAAARIQVDRDTRGFVYFGIAGALAPGHELVSDTGLVRAVRGVKSKAEVDIMRCANLATKAAIRAVLEDVTAGTTQAEVSAEIAGALSAAGLTNTWSIALYGPNAAAPHGITGNAGLKLTRGMMILLDAGGDLLGYQSDITRTVRWPLGTLTSDDGPEHYDRSTLIWNTVRQAHEAAVRAIRPGVRATDIDAAARDVVEAAGFGSDYETFTHRLGHGIGIDGHEDPYMNRGNEEEIRVGHCFSVEPGLYLRDETGVRIEDIVCVVSETAPYIELFGATSDDVLNPLALH